MTTPVPALQEISCDSSFVLGDEIFLSPMPVVLRNLVSDWPAVIVGKQSNRQLANYMLGFDGGRLLTALSGVPESEGRIFYNEDMTGFNFEYQRLSLTDAIQQILSFESDPHPPSLYVGSTNVDHWLPGFRAENDLPVDSLDPLASVWIGNRSRVAAHYDFPANIACVVGGRRRVTLLPPDQLENLYVGPLDFTPAGQPISMVDFLAPDLERFPKFKNALPAMQIVELEPGDAIMIPSMWWHHMEALDTFNVLVNYWWRNTPAFLGPPLSVLQHAILGLRDLPPDQREQWKRLFDFYVFEPDPEHFSHIPEVARGVLNPIDESIAKSLKAVLRDKLQ